MNEWILINVCYWNGQLASTLKWQTIDFLSGESCGVHGHHYCPLNKRQTKRVCSEKVFFLNQLEIATMNKWISSDIVNIHFELHIVSLVSILVEFYANLNVNALWKVNSCSCQCNDFIFALQTGKWCKSNRKNDFAYSFKRQIAFLDALISPQWPLTRCSGPFR